MFPVRGNTLAFRERHDYIVFMIPPEFTKKVSSKHWRCNNLYKIINKEGDLATFKFNEEQQELWDKCFDKKGNLKNNPNILKGRQIGITTFWAIVYLDDCIWGRNLTVFIQSHDDDSIKIIFRIVATAYKHMHPKLKPVLDRGGGSLYGYYFPQTGSRIYVGLKHRSGHVHRLHLSETAFQDPDRIAATLAALPAKQKHSSETTPNGMNFFQKDWKKDIDTRLNVFFCWLDHSAYRLNTLTELHDPDDILAEEEWIAQVTDYWGEPPIRSQMEFRRKKIFDFKGDIDKFNREYPSDPITCFLTSGKNFFKKLLLMKQIKAKASPIILRSKNGFIWFHKPNMEHEHLISSDTSEGLSDGDYGTIKAFDKNTREEICCFRGQEEPEDLADLLYWIGKKLCFRGLWPLIAVERNNHGHAVLLALSSGQKKYPNLYYYAKKKKGWLTDRITRPTMLDILKEGVYNGTMRVNDPTFYSEADTFVDINNKPQAEPGEHDDTIMCAAIAAYLFTTAKTAVKGWAPPSDLGKTSGLHNMMN